MISFGITTHNEGEELQQLFNQIIPYAQHSGDEVVVVDDYSTDELTNSLLETYSGDGSIQLFKRSLDNDFAAQKNFLTEKCSGEYIFQLDADEFLSQYLLTNLQDFVTTNPTVDLFCVPRINVVDGITDEDMERWRWTKSKEGYIQFPDYQARLYRRADHIRWHGKVHETIKGFKTVASFPPEEQYCIYHIKSIEKQRAQNAFYYTMENEMSERV